MIANTTALRWSSPGSVEPALRPAAEAADAVLATAGVWPHDSTANRAGQEISTRTCNWGNLRPTGWYTARLLPAPAQVDSDRDGVPGERDCLDGLDPASAADAHRIQSDRYPAIESYLAALCASLLPGAVSAAFVFGGSFE